MNKSTSRFFELSPRLLGAAVLIMIGHPALAQQGARAAFDQMVQAAQKGDEATLEKFQHPDATFIDGSGFNKGNKTYLEKVRNRVGTNAGHAELKNYRVRNVETQAVGNISWVTYQYELDAPVGDKMTPIIGFGTIIFRKYGNDWKVVHSQTAGRPMTASDPTF